MKHVGGEETVQYRSIMVFLELQIFTGIFFWGRCEFKQPRGKEYCSQTLSFVYCTLLCDEKNDVNRMYNNNN